MIYLKLYNDNQTFAENETEYNVGLTDKQNFHELPSVCLVEDKVDMEAVDSLSGASKVHYNPRPVVISGDTLFYDDKRRIFFELQLENNPMHIDGETPVENFSAKTFDVSEYATDAELEQSFSGFFGTYTISGDSKEYLEEDNLILVINPNDIPYKGLVRTIDGEEVTPDMGDDVECILYLTK